MICGGHAGKPHLKQLQLHGKQKKFTTAISKKEKEKFPEIENVKRHCKEEVEEKEKKGSDKSEDTKKTKKDEKPKNFKVISCRRGCGYLTDTFCQRARKSFSNILSTSQSASEFSRRLRGLVHHVQDEHQWEEERTCEKHDLTVCEECKFEQCNFHALTLCNCGDCEDKEQHECEGKLYHTREVLSCPFHLLAYKRDCLRRKEMADQLVHPILKRGHSNWLESSHNALIRFRPKYIALERLHYHVSTNLGLLQANMTYEYQQQGAAYH